MDYFSCELSRTQRAVFEEHLGICPACVAYVQSYGCTVKASKSAFDRVHVREASEVPEDLVRAILAARKTN